MSFVWMLGAFCAVLILGFVIAAVIAMSGERDTDQISKGRF